MTTEYLFLVHCAVRSLLWSVFTMVSLQAGQALSTSTRCVRDAAPTAGSICCTSTNGYFENMSSAGLMEVDTIFATDLFVRGSNNFDVQVSVTSIDISGTLLVTGSLTVLDGNTIDGSWLIGDDLFVAGDGCVAGDWCVGESLIVSGSATLASALLLNGARTRDLCISQSLCATELTAQNLIVNGTLIVDTPVTVTCSTVAEYVVTGSTVLSLTITGSLTVHGTTTVGGDICFGDNLVVTGSLCTQETLYVDQLFVQELSLPSFDGGAYRNLDRYSLLTSVREIGDVLGNPIEIAGALGAELGAAVALSGNGDVVAVSAPTANSVYLYQRTYTSTSSTWSLVQTITDPTINGSALALSGNGNVVAIGSDGASGGSGAVRIYQYNVATNLWVLQQTLTGSVIGEEFGASVSISAAGTYLAVGAPVNGAGNTGQIYIYHCATVGCPNGLSATPWVLQAIFSAPVAQAGALYGTSVGMSADGRFVLVGAPGTTSTFVNAGVAYFYQRSVNNWSLVQGPLPSPTPTLNGNFGHSVAFSNGGQYALIGAPGQGGAAIYAQAQNIQWSEQAFLSPSDGLGTTGWAVSISDDGTVAALAEVSDSSSAGGRVLIAQRFSDRWVILYQLTPSDGAAGDTFGFGTALSRDGSFLGVGAPLHTLTDDGALYLLSPVCSVIPTDLSITGSLCIQQDLTINGDLYITGSVTYGGTETTAPVTPCTICSSDEHLKENIVPLTSKRAFELLAQLHAASVALPHRELDSAAAYMYDSHAQELQEVACLVAGVQQLYAQTEELERLYASDWYDSRMSIRESGDNHDICDTSF